VNSFDEVAPFVVLQNPNTPSPVVELTDELLANPDSLSPDALEQLLFQSLVNNVPVVTPVKPVDAPPQITGKVYRLTRYHLGHPEGTLLYPFSGYDYGCSSDDTLATGVHHFSLSLDPNGGYPCLSVSLNDIEEVA
jgi:hypothetical protein